MDMYMIPHMITIVYDAKLVHQFVMYIFIITLMVQNTWYDTFFLQYIFSHLNLFLFSLKTNWWLFWLIFVRHNVLGL